ncbi:MAG: 4Fe-4S binding protein [Promethearchaeota archaeon]
MSESELESLYKKAAQVIGKQGVVPFPASETAIKILKAIIKDDEEELKLVWAFRRKPSQTMEQLKKATKSLGWSEEKIDEVARRLAKKGLLFNQPSSSGLMVYRILPYMAVGLMEYQFMGELEGTDEEKELAHLFEQLIYEVRDSVQAGYDRFVPLFQQAPPIDRTIPTFTSESGEQIRVIPVEETVDVGEEVVLPTQKVEELLDKFDDIAVGRCFCRQRRAMLGEPCDTDAPMMNCFTFGKSARHTVAQGFARPVSREEALKIMREAEAAGLVHKVFHPGSRETAPETSMCNCCKDCCDTLKLWRDGALPLINSTYHLSVIDPDACSGCGTCVERCPMDAIALNDDGVAERDADSCFGCGVCARFCPEGAISLKEGYRRVFILPPRLRSGAAAAGQPGQLGS